MSQSDGEPACQGKAYNASKDRKHLTRINKEEVLFFPNPAGPEADLTLPPTTIHSKLTLVVNDYS
jgi:hypothetical protein